MFISSLFKNVRSVRFHFLPVILIILCVFQPAYANIGKKKDKKNLVALMVGISYYEDKEALKRLDKPVKDVKKIKTHLKNFGFRVKMLVTKEEKATTEGISIRPVDASSPVTGDTPENENLRYDTSDTEASNIEWEWGEIVSNLDGVDVVLFYFAGHAIELKGRNYLLPSDTNTSGRTISNTGSITKSAIDLQAMIEELAKRQKNHKGLIGVFIIDACRENPFKWGYATKDEVPVGLGASVPPPGEMFIMYSAGIGQKALDGEPGAKNSVFAAALDKYLDEISKDQSLNRLADEVRFKVIQTVVRNFPGRSQTPAYYSQLSRARTLSGQPGTPLKISYKNEGLSIDWARLAHKDSFVECRYCPEMVIVDPASAPVGKSSKGSQKRYAIGKYEVTNIEWDSCVTEGGCKGGLRSGKDMVDGRKPVTDISWQQARQFVKWLNGIKENDSGKYRLPNEGEWEFAARAGAKGEYFFGDEPFGKEETLCQYANGADRSVGNLAFSYQHCSDGVARDNGYRGNP